MTTDPGDLSGDYGYDEAHDAAGARPPRSEPQRPATPPPPGPADPADDLSSAEAHDF